MRIEYVVNGVRSEVLDSVGEILIELKLARCVEETRAIQAEAAQTPRAGKQKRRYKRRDMRAEG